MNGYAFPALYVSWPSLEEAKPNVNEQMYSYLESYYNEYGELPASIWAYEVWDAMMTRCSRPQSLPAPMTPQRCATR